MKNYKLTILTALLILSQGCANYQHSRTTSDGIKESVSFNSFLMMGKASAIKSITKDVNGYSRSVSVGSLEGTGDTASIDALGNFASKIAEGTARGIKQP